MIKTSNWFWRRWRWLTSFIKDLLWHLPSNVPPVESLKFGLQNTLPSPGRQIDALLSN